MSIRHLSLGRGLMLLTVLCFCWQAVQQVARSQTLPDEDPGLGVLMLGDAGDWVPAVMLETLVQADINGPVANITLTQDFFNSHDDFTEASYLFPMPEQAAVHAMRIQIDERVIVGSIQEKAEAERIYNEAVAAGQQAAITQQLGANVFRTKVAHIGAGQSIRVTLEYRQILEPENGRFQLRVPTTLTPRYAGLQTAPGRLTADLTDTDWHTDEWSADVVSVDQIPLENANLFSLELNLNAGLELAEVVSNSHDIRINQSGSEYQIGLTDEYDLMDRDLVIEWEPRATGQPQLVALRERLDDTGEEFALMMLIPPKQQAIQSSGTLPREVIFVLDRSGSMGGELMRQASGSVAFAVRQLTPQDRFNIVDFSSDAMRWSEHSRFGSDENVRQAVSYVEKLEAGGGTNIADALHSALTLPQQTGWLRQVVFITDGAVADEAGVLNMISSDLGEARLFTVGIGYAPNSYFMRKAAELGRGTQHMISDQREVEPHMQALLTQLSQPVLRDIRMDLPAGVYSEQYPTGMPDLYFGEPLVVAARFERWPDWVQFSGFDGQPWTQRMRLSNVPVDSEGIAGLWARSRITELMDSRYQGVPEEQVRPQVVELALQHQLLSQYTSFVAVEQRPMNPDPGNLERDSVSNLLPRGMGYPAGGLGLNQWYLLAGIALLLFLVSHAGQPRRRADRV